MKKTKSDGNRRMKLLLGAGLALVVLVCLGILVANQITINNDRVRFDTTEQQKDIIATHLIASLGNNVTSTRKQNECFNAEQGPYDHGRLWCQVATVIKLGDFVSFHDLGRAYQLAAHTVGIAILSSGSSKTERFWFKNTNGITCNLVAIDSVGSGYGSASSIPFLKSDVPAVAIACSDRANIAYYPFRTQ